MKKFIVVVLMIFLSQSMLGAALERKKVVYSDVFSLKGVERISPSPDGRYLALEISGKIHIFKNDAHPLEDPIWRFDGSSPEWSPDSTKIAYYTLVDGVRQLFVWDVGMLHPEQMTLFMGGVTPNPWSHSAAPKISWAPDSRRLVFGSRPPLEQKYVDDSTVRVFDENSVAQMAVMDGVFRNDHAISFRGRNNPDFVTERIQAIAHDIEYGLEKIFILDVSNKSIKKLTEDGQYFSPQWSPDGRSIAAIEAIGSSARGVDYGSLLTLQLVLIDVKSNVKEILRSSRKIVTSPRWSPDGSQIATISRSGFDTFSEVEIFDIKNKRSMIPVLPVERQALDAAWSQNSDLLILSMEPFTRALWHAERPYKEWRRVDTGNRFIDEVAASIAGSAVYLATRDAAAIGRVDYLDLLSGKYENIYNANPHIADLALSKPIPIRWRNDQGDELDGTLLLPIGAKSGLKYPVIVDVYPIFSILDPMISPLSMGQAEAAAGYAVFKPAIRAPHMFPGGSGRDEKFGEKARGAKGIEVMLNDFESGISHLAKEGFIDESKVGVFGFSNGGWVANYLSVYSRIPKCIVSQAGSSSLLYQAYFPTFQAWTDSVADGRRLPEAYLDYLKLSPLLSMHEVRVPMMLIVGDDDWRPWLVEMTMQYEYLRRLGKSVTFIRYANQGHILTRDAALDARARIRDFFGNCLLKSSKKASL